MRRLTGRAFHRVGAATLKDVVRLSVGLHPTIFYSLVVYVNLLCISRSEPGSRGNILFLPDVHIWFIVNSMLQAAPHCAQRNLSLLLTTCWSNLQHVCDMLDNVCRRACNEIVALDLALIGPNCLQTSPTFSLCSLPRRMYFNIV